MRDEIVIRGARANNLKNISIHIPRDKLVVMTGLSGSGKSSLAFDTIYAEGQRRYVESLSSYARQFLGQMDKPDVDAIDGLSPAISIDQKTTSKNPRSTVGTVTEIYDYLRLLWARVGTPHCPKCGKEIHRQTVDQIVDQILAMPEGTRFLVLAPVIRGKKGEHVKVFEDARKSGYARVRVDGNLYELTEKIELNRNQKHNIEIVVDRLVGTLAQTARVGLEPDLLPVVPGPERDPPEPVGIALTLPTDVEGVEPIEDVLETDGTVDAQVHRAADLDRREVAAKRLRDERRRRRHGVGEEPFAVHRPQRVAHEILQFVGNGDVAVAVAVKKRVEFDAVRTRPPEVVEHPGTERRREVRRWAAGEDARPGEERLANAVKILRARRAEVGVEEMAYG